MMDQFVLQEIMELNTELSSMNISLETCTLDNDCIIIEEQKIIDHKVDENDKNKTKRSLRKRIRPPDSTAVTAKDSTKIQKMNDSVSNVEKYYLCKKVKRLPSTLETIFEEPKQQNNTKQYISARKFKRAIQFDEDLAAANRLKLRKRQLKAKKLSSSKGFFNRKKVSMDALLKKLSGVESDKE